jgi:hypothetical protein
MIPTIGDTSSARIATPDHMPPSPTAMSPLPTRPPINACDELTGARIPGNQVPDDGIMSAA